MKTTEWKREYPSDAKYITSDSIGCVFAYDEPPILNVTKWIGTGRSMWYIGKTEVDKVDCNAWKDSLRKIEEK